MAKHMHLIIKRISSWVDPIFLIYKHYFLRSQPYPHIYNVLDFVYEGIILRVFLTFMIEFCNINKYRLFRLFEEFADYY